MSKSPPWYKREPGAWRVGTRGMSLELRGFYSEFLDAMWEQQAQLPKDTKWLSLAFGCSTRMVRALLPRLVAAGKIIETVTGYYNPRMMADILGLDAVAPCGQFAPVAPSIVSRATGASVAAESRATRAPVERESSASRARVGDESSAKNEKNPMNSTRARVLEESLNLVPIEDEDEEEESPKPPRGLSDDDASREPSSVRETSPPPAPGMPAHVKPVRDFRTMFAVPDDGSGIAVHPGSGALTLSDRARSEWLERFGGDGRALDLALIEVAGRLEPHSRRPLASQVGSQLARIAGDKHGRDQRYREAAARNGGRAGAAAASGARPTLAEVIRQRREGVSA